MHKILDSNYLFLAFKNQGPCSLVEGTRSIHVLASAAPQGPLGKFDLKQFIYD